MTAIRDELLAELDVLTQEQIEEGLAAGVGGSRRGLWYSTTSTR